VPFFIPCLKHERRNFVPVSQGLSNFPGYLVNQLRIENRKLSEKITDQAKEIAALRHEANQLKTEHRELLKKMTDDASSDKGGIF
jgi:predicted RNase H-like nuclease (RuvC/YqgF family)